MTHRIKHGAALLLALTAVAAPVQAAGPRAGERVAPAVPAQAALFPLEDVRLLPGPFRDAQETDRAYLLRLDPDRLMSWMRKNAGLTPKAAPYAGWDRDGSGVVGHYLSACAQMAQATGDPALHKRVDYVVSEMAACQTANGDGGLYAFDWDKTTYFSQMAAGHLIHTDVTAWYTEHKILAGLRDASELCGSVQARDVLVRMADWCVSVTAKLTDDQWQTMLSGEHGAPHEILADVYAMTGDRKYLDCAEKFKHLAVFDPLAKGDASVLTGLHANTQIPKFVGYERIYQLTGDRTWDDAARSFWENVTGQRSWANGGDSQWEHFFAPAETEKKMLEISGPETCNTYNMLKLTRQLYTRTPSARYMDYYERALYNHILPSEAPSGGFAYYTPMRPGHYRVFSRDYDAFWCCVGTGMENHGEYGGMIYAAAPNRLYVNLFIPSVLTDRAQGLTLTQATRFPEEPRTRLALTLTRPRRMTLSLRYPAWVAPGALSVRINGRAVPVSSEPGSFVNVSRLWRTGDRIEMALPMRLTTEPLPDSAQYAAFFYGPVLLAGRLGTEGLTLADFHGGGPIDVPIEVSGQTAQKKIPESHVPIFLGTVASALPKIVRVAGQPLTFQTHGLAQPQDVTLVPFYRLFFERYALYWNVLTPDAYARRLASAAAEQRDADTLEARTIDHVMVGDAASEAAHALASDRSQTGGASAPFAHWRDAKGSFGYILKLPTGQPAALRCVYWGGDAGRTFDILVDGTKITTQTLTGARPGEYFAVTTPLPDALTRGKMTVRFAPTTPGQTAGGLYDVRVVRP